MVYRELNGKMWLTIYETRMHLQRFSGNFSFNNDTTADNKRVER